ncbi:MAG TPA: thioesterase family protein [Bacteroidota bacterium]|jgi:acyl-CoA thioester hydrolase|nr:thioesterase family protein [Bacteroidota bacterium]
MIRHVSQIRVRYADTDQMKFVYYGKFFEYFEQGRSDLLRGIGLPYPRIEEMGLFLPVIEAHASYKRAARYDDLLNIVTLVRDMPIARVRLEYEVYKEGESELLADGYTIHTFVNATTGRPTRAPAQFIETIEKSLNAKPVKV